MKLMKRLLKEEDGQGIVEYALIAALISIVAIAFVTGVGEKTSNMYAVVKNEIFLSIK